MKRAKRTTTLILAGFTAGLLLSIGPTAFAWARTIPYTGPILSWLSPDRARIAIQSDTGWTGAPSGNAATTIYVDFTTNGPSKNSPAQTNVIMQACAYSFNASGGGCGAASNGMYNAGSPYDIAIAKWAGTGSQWDYFYIDIINGNGGALQPLGVGISGT
jgi:hypothetical protein